MSSVSAALNSRTLVRLLPWAAGAVLALGIVVFLLVFFRNTGNPSLTSGGKSAPVKAVDQRTVPLDPSIKTLADQFLRAAVAGHDPVLAYKLSGPSIRQGSTLRQWVRDWNNPNVGVPIIPWPVDKAKASPFRVDASYPNDALLEVALLAKPGAGIKDQIFYIEFKKFGKGKKAHWLVDYWGPHNIVITPQPQ
jgi:hypothetical protein